LRYGSGESRREKVGGHGRGEDLLGQSTKLQEDTGVKLDGVDGPPIRSEKWPQNHVHYYRCGPDSRWECGVKEVKDVRL